MSIKIKNEEEIEKIRVACKIVAEVLQKLKTEIKPGITTLELDKLGEKLIRQRGGIPVFIGYRGYKHATCISVNCEVVHGIPSERKLQEGDIVSVDLGAKLNGFCGDIAATFPAGAVSKKAAKLLKAGKDALWAAIRQARVGHHLGDISYAIQSVAKSRGYSVVRELYGHGLGQDLHEDPLIPNYGESGKGLELKPGMVLAIEPMINMGGWQIKTLEDGWTVETLDKSLSCHFEHTVSVTEGRPEVLTLL